MLCASQGDQGFPGAPGLQGERGIGEPGPKVTCTHLSLTLTRMYNKYIIIIIYAKYVKTIFSNK